MSATSSRSSFAGSHARDPAQHRALELTLRTLTAAGFDLRTPARHHFRVGFVFDEGLRVVMDGLRARLTVS